jgi:hypothetical protein
MLQNNPILVSKIDNLPWGDELAYQKHLSEPFTDAGCEGMIGNWGEVVTR